jgi:hypothetical protein
MIRTRPSTLDMIVGDGEFLIAMSQDEITLIGALLGLVKLGHKQYEQAAMNILEALEEITDDSEFCNTALADVQPVIDIRDPQTFDVIAQYDDTMIIEINV